MSSTLPFYGRLVLSFACLLLGTFPILAGFGLIELESPIEPLAIPISILFGAVFLTIGVAAVWEPARAIATAHGASSKREVRAAVGAGLRARVTRDSSAAALSVALLALAFWLRLAGLSLPLVGEQETLVSVVVIEFMTVHAFPFLVVLTTFFVAMGGAARLLFGLVLTMCVLVYGTLAWVVGGGVQGIAWLAYLLVPNVLVFTDPRVQGGTRVLVVSRWCVKLFFMLVILAMLSDGDVAGASSIAVGALYFSVLVLVELFRIVELPRDLAAQWVQLQEERGWPA